MKKLSLKENIAYMGAISTLHDLEFINLDNGYNVALSAKNLPYSKICELCDNYNLVTLEFCRKIGNTIWDYTGNYVSDKTTYRIIDGFEFITALCYDND